MVEQGNRFVVGVNLVGVSPPATRGEWIAHSELARMLVVGGPAPR